MEDDNYAALFNALMCPANTRNARMIRLAAVAVAIYDVVGGFKSDCSASKVYAATISALEGTLQSDAQDYSSSLHELQDSLSTQVALLEIFRVTIPFVSNPGVVDASLALSSRVLRGVLLSSLKLDTTEIQEQLDSNDEVGGINAVLRALCKACTELLKQLTSKADGTLVKHCFGGTLMALLEDRRPKVRKAAQNAIAEVLVHSSKHGNPIIVKSINSLFRHQLRSSFKKVNQGEDPNTKLLHLLSFLESTMSHLDISYLGTAMMELFAALLKLKSYTDQSDFVAIKPDSNNCEPKIFAINALLSAIKKSLEGISEKQEKSTDALCSRVLATMLQNKPNLVFQEGSADMHTLHRGRTLYGSVVISSCDRVIVADPVLACKLLPVSVQMIVQLCRVDGEEIDLDMVEPLLTELVALFRCSVPRLLLLCPPSDGNTCTRNTMKALEQVLLPSFQATWSVSLKALVIFLQLVDENEVPNVVEKLLKLHSKSGSDATAQRSVEAAVGSLIEAVGVEIFWNWVNWTSLDEGKDKCGKYPIRGLG